MLLPVDWLRSSIPTQDRKQKCLHFRISRIPGQMSPENADSLWHQVSFQFSLWAPCLSHDWTADYRQIYFIPFDSFCESYLLNTTVLKDFFDSYLSNIDLLEFLPLFWSFQLHQPVNSATCLQAGIGCGKSYFKLLRGIKLLFWINGLGIYGEGNCKLEPEKVEPQKLSFYLPAYPILKDTCRSAKCLQRTNMGLKMSNSTGD